MPFYYLVMAALGFGEGNGNPLLYSCLENPMDGGAWWAAVLGVAKSRTRLSDLTFTLHFHPGESCQPRDQTHVSHTSCMGRWVLYH